jgi:hypothetical protein
MMTRTAALIVGCALMLPLLQPRAAGAETHVSGAPDAVRVDARGASLDEVLGALAGKFNLNYRAKVPLDRRVNGVFSGSLSRVIARLLDGYDHVVKRNADGIEVVILSVSPKSTVSSGGQSL